jgi:ABC-type phosphate/phosphonate transport system substrate-binding protein
MSASGGPVGRTPLVASLPMYDFPEVREATDAFWLAIATRLRSRGVPAPLALTHDNEPLEKVWTHPRLLVSQTCGYPLMTHLRDEVVVVGTPSYRAQGCDGAFHRSAVIVRAGSDVSTLAELKGFRCAVNSMNSNTGMNLLRSEVAMLASCSTFFDKIVETGSHAASVEGVVGGRADLAAIDAVTYALLERHRPALMKAVRVLHWTVRSPGLPFVTSRRRSGETLIALQQVMGEVATVPQLSDVRRELMLTGFSPLSQAHYRSVLRLAQIAADSGYPELC